MTSLSIFSFSIKYTILSNPSITAFTSSTPLIFSFFKKCYESSWSVLFLQDGAVGNTLFAGYDPFEAKSFRQYKRWLKPAQPLLPKSAITLPHGRSSTLSCILQALGCSICLKKEKKVGWNELLRKRVIEHVHIIFPPTFF